MSIGIKFLYNFSVGEYDYNNPGGNVISVTSQAAGDHDKKNLTTTALRETYRTSSITGYQDIIIRANDTSVSPDTFAILNHNLSEFAVVLVQGSMTSSFSTPAFSTSMQYNEKHMVLLGDVGVAYNYYRFRILDPANECGFIEIGRILAGTSFTFDSEEDITDDISLGIDDLAYAMPTEGFFRAFNERVKLDKITLKFEKLKTRSGENANWLGLRDLIKSVGVTFPFLTVVDPGDQYFQLVWGQLAPLPTTQYTINRYANLSLTIQEVY